MYRLISEQYGIAIYSINDIYYPLNYIVEIEKEISGRRYHTIIFDFLLCRGNGNKRFAHAEVDKDDKIILETLEYYHVPKKHPIRKVCCDYYKKNKESEIQNSILTSIQKKMLLKGIAI